MKKNIVIIYYGDDWSKEIPFSSEHTRSSFEDWHRRGQQKNVNLFRASIKWFDLESGTFTKAWAFRNEKWKKISEPIKPDLIFDKVAGKHDYELFDFKMKINQKIKIFNHPLFRTAFDNKFSQYVTFREFMPKTFLATSQKDFSKKLKKIKSQKVVIKPPYGSGGFGIIIDEKEKVDSNGFIFPVLIQEFIESNNGIPGFSQSSEISDLRMIYVNHKFIYALSRKAKEGSFFTNFHQGATAILVPAEKIPRIVTKAAKRIVRKLSMFPEANYSLDFIFTNEGKPVLMELNTTPGFDLLNIVGTEEIKEMNFTEFIKIVR